jgi:hypothetical protein
MNQPEFYTAIGFDEPVDVNELSEENRKFFFEQFSPKPVKQNDPAVNAETNVGSTNDTVSQSEDGSSDLLLKAEETVSAIQFSKEEEAAKKAEYETKFEEIQKGKYDNKINRYDEGEAIANKMKGDDDDSFQNTLATMFGDAYGGFKTVTDRIAEEKIDLLKGVSRITSGSSPIISGIATIGSAVGLGTLEEETESSVVENMEFVDRQDLEDYDIYNKAQ